MTPREGRSRHAPPFPAPVRPYVLAVRHVRSVRWGFMVSFLMWLPQLYYSLPPKHTSRAHHKLSEGSRAEGLACGILPTHPLQSGDPVLRILSHLCEGSQCRSVGPRPVLSGPLTFCDTSRREKKQTKQKNEARGSQALAVHPPCPKTTAPTDTKPRAPCSGRPSWPEVLWLPMRPQLMKCQLHIPLNPAF